MINNRLPSRVHVRSRNGATSPSFNNTTNRHRGRSFEADIDLSSGDEDGEASYHSIHSRSVTPYGSRKRPRAEGPCLSVSDRQTEGYGMSDSPLESYTSSASNGATAQTKISIEETLDQVRDDISLLRTERDEYEQLFQNKSDEARQMRYQKRNLSERITNLHMLLRNAKHERGGMKERIEELEERVMELEEKVQANEEEKAARLELPDLTELEESITCTICFERMQIPMTIRECAHTFCKRCLYNWFYAESRGEQAPPGRLEPGQEAPRSIFTCPNCRTRVTTRLLEPFLLRDVVTKVANILLAQNRE